MIERFYNARTVHALKGKTVTEIDGMHVGSRQIIFRCSDGTAYKMFHEEDDTESVYVYDVKRLGGAYEVPSAAQRDTDDDDPVSAQCSGILCGEITYAESITFDWEPLPPYCGRLGVMGMAKTIFLLATGKGVVALTWNGFSDDPTASTEVDFVQTEGDGVWKGGN